MTSNRWRWLVWSGSAVLLLILAGFWSQLETIQSGGAQRIIFHSLMWVTMCGMVFAFPRLRRKRAIMLLLGAALVVRLVLWSAPVSDDVNRYLWEGSLMWKGENPYAMTADHEAWTPLRDQYWEAMNHRDRATAYPPGMELVMAGASWLWYDLQVFKVIALLGDFWILAVLILMVQRDLKPLRYLGFYAFNPIVLASFSIEAHLDSLMVGAMLTALLMAKRKSWGWAWFWLGLAVQFKFIVIILVPYFLVIGDWKKIWSFLLIMVLPSLCFGDHFWQAVVGLVDFGNAGAFNGGLFETLRLIGLSDGLARRIGMILFVCVGLVFGWRTLRGKESDLTSLSFVIVAILVVCSPVVHFWYLTWAIPFVVLRPSLSWVVLCLTTSLYFLAWENLELSGVWGYHRVWVVVSWIPFFMIALWEYRYAWRQLSEVEFQRPTSIDLVVPVYHAGENLLPFVRQLRDASPEAGRLIISDGGSADGSIEQLKDEDLHIVSSDLGRGAQIAAGVAASRADLVAIVHADTEPVKGWLANVLKVAQARPRVPAFVLGQRFTPGSFCLLFVEVLNEARAIFGGSIFGDQTMIVRREALDRIGGFPTQPLMEDVEVSWCLLERGRISYLGEEWNVSAQKWDGRFISRFRQVIGLMIRYRWTRLKGREAAADFSQRLYREYYRKNS